MSGLKILLSKYAKEDKTEAISRASRAKRPRGNKTTKVSRLRVVQNNVSYIYKIASVQNRFTKRQHCLQSDPYSLRLCKLSLDKLEMRRLRFDLVMIFDVIHEFIEVDIPKLFFKLF